MTDDDVQRITAMLANYGSTIHDLPHRLAEKIGRALPPGYTADVDAHGGISVRKSG